MLIRILLVLLTPLMLWLGWPENGFTPLLFIAFVPLLFVERSLSLSAHKKTAWRWFWYCWLAFGLWNLLGTWWLVNAHWSGVLITVIVNGLLMTLVMVLFRFIKMRLGSQRGYIALPFLWICLEMLHKNWDLSFPWLNLGNGFASHVEWIQWYEISGSMGGTLWVWIINLLFFRILVLYLDTRQLKPALWRSLSLILLGIVLPVSLSYMRYLNYEEKGESANIVVVQPNIDTYTEKNLMSDVDQTVKFLRLANLKLNDSVDFLAGPEVLLPDGMYEDQIAASPAIKLLRNTADRFPNLNIIVGATTLRYYANAGTTPTAHPFNSGDGYYDDFNTALLINGADSIKLYHKSKLVAGVEMMPFSTVLKPLLGGVIDAMGGSSSTLGHQNFREVFSSEDGRFRAAPIICWESDFGEYVSGYVRRGANLLFIITNDDWWGDTPGYRDHMQYARLRSIENRRSLARSANTGISCFINQRGDVFQSQGYKKDAVIQAHLKANNEFTFYTRSGDVIGNLSLFMGGFLLLFAIVRGYLQRVQTQV